MRAFATFMRQNSPPEALLDRDLFPGLAGRLPIGVMGSAFYPYRSCDSTQAQATRLAAAGAPEGSVVVAEVQTSGRGRHGRSWWGESGNSLLVSVILRPEVPVARTPHFSLLAAVSSREALKSVTNLPIAIKWPNDLLVAGKKVAGILVEAGSIDKRVLHLVVGIGINTGQRSFPPDIKEKATSLTLAAGRPVSREEVLGALLRSLDRWYRVYLDAGFPPVREAWRRGTATLGQWVKVPSQSLEGTALDLDDDGALVLLGREGRRHRVIAGEIE